MPGSTELAVVVDLHPKEIIDAMTMDVASGGGRNKSSDLVLDILRLTEKRFSFPH